jgi:hypothetical protein
MKVKRTVKILRVLVLVLILQSISPVLGVNSSTSANDNTYRLAVSGNPSDAELQQLYNLLPAATTIVDRAIESLSKGLAGLEPGERESLLRYYDPAGTGEIDEAYVSQVLENYRRIRAQLNKLTRVEYETDSEMCDLQRLYYTDLVSIHICPYAATETRTERLARQWVHELVHISLLVVDRPYYQPVSTAYAALTPRGSWTSQIPLIGPILREIAHNDTLYHPDAYARYAAALVAEPQPEPAPAPQPVVISSGEDVVDMAVLRHQNAID